MSRSDYDDMPSGNGRRNGKGSRNMAVGLLIAILVILIIIVVKLIVSPEEKIEALPPVSSQSIVEETVSESPVLAAMEEEENTSPDSIEDFETDGGVAHSEESTLNLVDEERVGDSFPSDSMEGETEEVSVDLSLESTRFSTACRNQSVADRRSALTQRCIRKNALVYQLGDSKTIPFMII